jgi:hypothetical protein
MDNGNGLARSSVFMHKHEMVRAALGRLSALGVFL